MNIEEVISAYGLGEPQEILPWTGGTANENFRVRTSAGDYFIKWRVPRLSYLEQVRLQHRILLYLAEDGQPVQPPLKPRNSDDTFLNDGHRLWEVAKFTAGGKFRGARCEIASAGSTLARLHSSLASFPSPASAALQPLHENREQLAASLHLAEPILASPELATVREAFLRAFDLLDQKFYGTLEAELERGIIHGDYHALNLLFGEDGEVVGVFDWDATGVQIRLRDVVDGLIAFGRKEPEKFGGKNIIELTRAFEFAEESLNCFLTAYQNIRPLSPVEIRALPLMLRQRWLGIKLDPLRLGKVDAAGAVELMKDADRPLQWLEETDLSACLHLR